MRVLFTLLQLNVPKKAKRNIKPFSTTLGKVSFIDRKAKKKKEKNKLTILEEERKKRKLVSALFSRYYNLYYCYFTSLYSELKHERNTKENLVFLSM